MSKNMLLPDGSKITHAQNDARYVARGRELVLGKELTFDNPAMKKELRKMNRKKNGRPFTYPDTLFLGLATMRVMCSMGYRELQGMAEEILGKQNVLHYTEIYRRILALDTKLDDIQVTKIGRNKIRVLVDGSGLEPYARGEFIRAKHALRRGFVRFTTLVDHDTLKIIGYEITDESTGEASNLETTLEDALTKLGIGKKSVTNATDKVEPQDKPESTSQDKLDIEMLGDGYYSNTKVHAICEKLGVKLVAPVPSNATAKVRGRKGGHKRKQAVLDQLGGGASPRKFAAMTDEQRMENRKKWKKEVGYGRRWAVEIFFSSFKSMFGSAVHAVKMKNIVKEIELKTFVYNKIRDISMEAMC